MIKTILVPATGNETDIATFAAALRVAQVFAAQSMPSMSGSIRLRPGRNDDRGSGAALIGGLVEQLEQDAASGRPRRCEFSRISVGASGFPSPRRRRREGAPIGTMARRDGRGAPWMTRYGLAADLIVASRGPADDPPRVQSLKRCWSKLAGRY